MYQITKYTQDRARELGVTVKPSTNPKKKIDVFKNGHKIASVGAIGYADYPTYMRTEGKEYADERRRLYRQRHSKDTGVAGYYANKLLW